MPRFVVLTRGRTGSSAIVEELGAHPEVTCHSEVFKRCSDAYLEAWHALGEDCLKEPGWRLWNIEDRVLPYDLFCLKYGGHAELDDYLLYLESQARGDGTGFLGFKLLVDQVEDRPELRIFEFLDAHEFRILYLRRKDIVAEALSCVAARMRGIFQFRQSDSDFEEKRNQIDRSLVLDPNDVVKEIGYIRYWVDACRDRLEMRRSDVLEIFYEDFVNERTRFFLDIQRFLGTTGLLPDLARTNLVKVLGGNNHRSIANLEEILTAVQNAWPDLERGP